MRWLLYQMALAILALSWAAAPALAGVTFTGDTTDNASYFAAGSNPNTTGGLVIDAGSVFDRPAGYLGLADGSTGTAIVTGAGSKWTNSVELKVGPLGTGMLTVSNGGSVSANTLYASLSDLHGNGTIIVQSGAVLDADLVFDANHGATQVLAFGSGGALQLTVDGTNPLGVGYRHSGSLRIADGRSITSSLGYLGYWSGSTGAATVTGAGSKWINSAQLQVAYHGSGTLTVSDGGLVSAKMLYASLSDLHGNGTILVQGGAILDADLVFGASGIATAAFGSGGTLQVTVDGTSYLGAGYKQSGSLRIAEGQSITSSGGYLGYSSGSTGAAIVTGAGSKWINSGSLSVGVGGSGTLNVEAAGQVSNSNGYIGGSLVSSGTVTVTGAGSKWTNSGELWVGHPGTGSLTVSDGGLVSAKTLYASLSDLHGNGTITVQSGAVLDADMAFDATHGATQALPFGSGGTLQLTVDGKSPLGAGYRQSGSLRIAEGRSITSSGGYFGYKSGSTGTATVTGAGSKWTNYSLYVGYSGSGTVTVEAAGQVSGTSMCNLGYDSGASGTVIVTGAGSKATNSNLYVGRSGTGTLKLEDGGQFSDTYGYLGFASRSMGAAIITGAGSKWGNGTLYVGSSGTGMLNVEAGAQVSDGFGYLGYDSGSSGSAIVTGAGSQWTSSAQLYVGYSGLGTLRVEAGGQVSNDNSYLGYNSGSSGTVTVTGAGSKWTNSGNLTVAGSGSLNVEAGGQVGSNFGFIGGATGSSGNVTVTGAGSKWTNTGSLVVGGATGTLTVSDGGLVTTKTIYASLSDLHGNGTIATSGVVLDADLVFDAKHGATQALAFGAGGTLQFTINGIGALGAGYKHFGSLRIAEGRSVTSSVGYLGYNSGSGTAIVTGAGSIWTSSGELRVGSSGSGTLNVEAGGRVSDTKGLLGYNLGSSGTATVTGAGSKWTNSSSLWVGYGFSESGVLAVSDGGQVTATAMSIKNSQSTLRLHVSSDNMLLLGSSSTAGSVSNDGQLVILADTFLAAGTYRPIGEYAGRTMSWSGSGSTSAVGGTWDSSARIFTVLAPTPVNAGASVAVGSGQRLLISDSLSGDRAGVSFGTLTSGTTLMALPVSANERAALLPLLQPQEAIFSGWDFAGPLAGGEALLSFDVGQGARDLHLWCLSQNAWNPYTPQMMTYDAHGIVSFTVDPASLNSGAYALSGTVPEPATLGLLALTSLTLLTRSHMRLRDNTKGTGVIVSLSAAGRDFARCAPGPGRPRCGPGSR